MKVKLTRETPASLALKAEVMASVIFHMFTTISEPAGLTLADTIAAIGAGGAALEKFNFYMDLADRTFEAHANGNLEEFRASLMAA